MIHRVYAILDSKAAAGLQPFFSVNDATAQRACAVAVNDANHDFGRFPADYVLYCIGQYDDSSLSMEVWAPMEVCKFLSLVNRE